MSVSRNGVAVVATALVLTLGACGGSGKAKSAGVQPPGSSGSSSGSGASGASGAAGSAASSPNSANPSSASTSAASPDGPDCGQIGTDSNGAAVRLFITGGPLSCAEAKKIYADYGAAAKEGSGGFATVDGGWQCGHNSVAGIETSGVQAGCQNDTKSFETRVGTQDTSGGSEPGGAPTSDGSSGGGVPPTGTPKGRLTGNQLAAILAGVSSFPHGTSATDHADDSGPRLVSQPTDPGGLFRSASCADNATLPDYSVLGTAYAHREYAVQSAFSATIDQFQDNATVSAYLTDRTSYIQRCQSSRFPGSALQTPTVAGLPATVFTMPGLHEVIVIDGPYLIDVSANTPAGQGDATSTPPEKVAADIVAALAR
ncbi:hypothetical protein [Catenulispora subtropica]|uniref:hypothetical protein n=1 Tax=Catenulispora subtropica TaxID=450798 RepID=UPI0031D6AD84